MGILLHEVLDLRRMRQRDVGRHVGRLLLIYYRRLLAFYDFFP